MESENISLMPSRRTFLHALALAAAPQFRAPGPDPATKDLAQPQLFLDDTWIDDSQRLQRAWEGANILPEPVLKPELPWEGRQLVLYGSVFRDASGWRMYYMSYDRPAPSLLCMATSTDGLHWERPRLGLFEFGGNKNNNIVFAPAPGQMHDGPTICHDPADPAAPYKMIYYSRGAGRAPGEYVAFSRDGIEWRHQPGPVLRSGDRTNVLASRDHRGKFVAYLRHTDMMKLYRARTVSRSESDDFLHWSEPAPVLRPDLLDDPNTELYGMAAFRYSDLYLGLLERWYDNPDVIELELAWSHDGLAWQRAPSRPTFLGAAFPWNRGWSTGASTPPIRVSNQLWFYFGGRSGAHGLEAPHSYGAIGIASVGADRFAALRADFQEGLLLTRPLTWPGGELLLTSTNTRYPKAHPSSGGGSISVEVRDENNRPLAGYSDANRAPVNYNSVAWGAKEDRPAVFPGGRPMRELAGKRIRLAFFLKDARLYAFRAGR
jgi:hypothetical protein